MNLSHILKTIITEKKGDSYEYGCAMLYFKAPEIKVIQDHIKPEDLYEEEGDRTYGLEDEPHCTLLFGIHDGVSTEEISDVLDEHTFDTMILNNASLFKNEKYEVFKLDVVGSNLAKINEELCELPHTNKFPDYHPHATIAYLKPGTGERYVKALQKGSWKVSPEYVVYSKPDGSKDKIKINVR